ncbi:MAG: glycosyltransferase family 2 protein [Porphyromonadaceae bacterium]|nr:glycosyltransferase family 2 protein [Porphyromonadaceae bacterium]
MRFSQHKEVAVLVLNWNGRTLLQQFLPSWLAHTPDYADLIIVDNGSTDDSVSFLQEHYRDVHLLAFEENLGFAGGYNRAIEELDYQTVILLNSDVELTSGWLDQPMQLLNSSPEIAAVQPTLRAQRSPNDFEYAGAAGGFIDRLGYPFCRGRIFDTIEEDRGQYADSVDLFWASGACLIIRRAVYREVGGLDTLFFAHQEEIDLCWRLNARGWRIVSAPQSIVYHVGGASLSADSPRKVFLNFRNNLLMIYKNLPAPTLYRVLFARMLLDLVAMLVYLLRLRPGQAASVLKGWRCFLIKRQRYESTRQENLKKTVRPISPELMKPYSLLFQYYFKGRKRYSDLP